MYCHAKFLSGNYSPTKIGFNLPNKNPYSSFPLQVTTYVVTLVAWQHPVAQNPSAALGDAAAAELGERAAPEDAPPAAPEVRGQVRSVL